MLAKRAKKGIVVNIILLLFNLVMAILGFPFNLVIAFLNIWAIKVQYKALLMAIELEEGNPDVY